MYDNVLNYWFNSTQCVPNILQEAEPCQKAKSSSADQEIQHISWPGSH
jgi:hypothetical protein